MARSPDKGQTWQQLDFFDKMFINDWEEFNGELYVAGDSGVGIFISGSVRIVPTLPGGSKTIAAGDSVFPSDN